MSNTELKKVKGRVQNKHKTEAEWLLDVYPNGDRTQNARTDAFIPLAGELIIYDPDSIYDYPRFKFGNGTDNVDNLSFITEDSTVPSISFNVTTEITPLEVFDKMRTRGLTGQWTVVNFSGRHTDCYGLFLNWYGDDVYALTGINLANGGFASNTNAWWGKTFTDFQISFERPLHVGQYNVLNTTDQTILGAINELKAQFDEGGADGEDGQDGREIELQKGTTHIQWRYVGDTTWTNLVALADLKGADGEDGQDGTNGKEVQLQKTTTHIQWRLTGGSWANLVALSDLKGADGTDGTSVTITNISQNNSAGGTSTVTFSDGKTLSIKNGTNGKDGTDGTNGTSVTVSNVSESTADGGSNVVTFSDGKTLTVKNGNKGTDGKTPVKGTDYFTSTEIDNIATQAAGKVTVVDEKVKATARTDTTNYYLTGAKSATTPQQVYYDTEIHLGDNTGELCMKSCNLNTSANPAKLVYDDAKKSIKFVFN